MINKICLTLSFLSVSAIAFAQAKKPTLMVIPTEAWCYENDFSYEVNNQGRKTRITDYEKAFQESSDLLNATTKIGELMADRGFPLKDMLSSIRDIDRMEAENEMTQSSQGSMIAETPLERLMTRAKADIMVELGWKVNSIHIERNRCVHQQAGCRSPRHRLAVTIGRNPATITGSGCSQYG